MAKRARSASASSLVPRRPRPPPPVSAATQVPLSDAQRAIVAFIEREPADGASVFITGPGGVGKSVVLRAAIAALKEALGDEALAVTASTGIAAFDIGGMTLHRFAGVGLALSTATRATIEAAALAMYKEKKFARTRQRWRRTRVLVLDEVSMVSARTFDNFWLLARLLGGIHLRLVVCGDFLQLPPVVRGETEQQQPLFAFESEGWRLNGFKTFVLRHSFRQSSALRFAALLDQVRRGRLSEEGRAALQARVGLPPPNMASGKGAAAAAQHRSLAGLVTHIYPLNRDVDAKNAGELVRIPGASHTFLARDWLREPHHARLLDDVRALARLELKAGAQVMLLRNLPQEDPENAGLVNGAVGRVAYFEKDDADADAEADAEAVPYVLFPTRPGSLAVQPRRIEPLLWELHEGATLVATRQQLPLNLAYAMSVHKSQGQTITCAVVADLGSVFEYGQAYVLLSRVKCLEQLFLTSFRPEAIRAHPRAIAFYDALAAASGEAA